MKTQAEIDTPAYRKGYKHGYETGNERNNYKNSNQYWEYRRGYEAGVADYCREAHPEDYND